MFHYIYRDIEGKSHRRKHDIAHGDIVRSRYRAPWSGRVIALNSTGGLATVRQMLDRHGKPFRKPKDVTYHCNWFRVIERYPT
jgi:hypothetical protein